MKVGKRNSGAGMNSQGPNMESLAESLILLGHRAVAEYKPVVDSILNPELLTYPPGNMSGFPRQTPWGEAA
jgi:hypothetical protein